MLAWASLVLVETDTAIEDGCQDTPGSAGPIPTAPSPLPSSTTLAEAFRLRVVLIAPPSRSTRAAPRPPEAPQDPSSRPVSTRGSAWPPGRTGTGTDPAAPG